METNTYDTFCEAPSCRESVIYRAENFDAAIAHVRSLGWLAEKREGGYLSLCPAHKEGRTETMQLCSKCGQWCRRTLNVCPTCTDAEGFRTVRYHGNAGPAGAIANLRCNDCEFIVDVVLLKGNRAKREADGLDYMRAHVARHAAVCGEPLPLFGGVCTYPKGHEAATDPVERLHGITGGR